MRKRLFTLAMLLVTVFAVSAIAGAQAYSPPKRHEQFMLQVGKTSGTFLGTPRGNPLTATVYDVTFSGTGTVSWLGTVTIEGTEVDTFNSPPPTFTSLVLMGTMTLTDNAGDTLTMTYQLLQGTASSPFHGTYQITGGTGRFWDAIGGGLAWGTDTVTGLTATGTTGVWTMDFVGVISF
jgi:hypothetical protein